MARQPPDGKKMVDMAKREALDTLLRRRVVSAKVVTRNAMVRVGGLRHI